MRFKTIKEYDSNINDIEDKLNKYKDYVNSHPEKIGVQQNYKLLKYICDELKKERNELLSLFTVEDINLHISGEMVKDSSIPSNVLINMIKYFEDINKSIAKVFSENNLDSFNNIGFNIKPFEVGSFVVTFSPKVDVGQSSFDLSLTQKSFDKLCDLISLDENPQKIKEEFDEIGLKGMQKYQNFVKLISDNELNITLGEGKNDKPKANLGYEKAFKIYDIIKKLRDEEVNIESIDLDGKFYYINIDSETCGFKFFDSEENSIKKISRIKFRESFKSEIKEKLDLETKITVEKSMKLNEDSENVNVKYDLINIH